MTFGNGARPRPLLAGLMVRAGFLTAPAPLVVAAPLPPKRPRGRPRKQPNVADLAARVWDDVTGGAGVVLVDGEPVEVLKDLK